MDDPELLDLVELEVRELLKSYQFPGDDVPVVRLSALGALNGEAKWEKQIDELMEAVDKNVPQPARELDKPFLMPIEDIFSISGPRHGGDGPNRARQGEGRRGSGNRRLPRHAQDGGDGRRNVQEAAGRRPGGRQRRTAAARHCEGRCGARQVLAKAGSITPHTKFKGEVYMLTKEEGGRHTPFFKGYRPQFYFRTTDVTGVAELPAGTEMVMPGDNVQLVIELITPVAMEKGLRFAIREGGRTVGAGTISEIIK